MSRYIIGIDLGTTNIAVAYLDGQLENPTPTIFRIPQVVEAGETDVRDTLPSFLYLPDENEVAAGALDLPWQSGANHCIGAYARKNASSLPGRIVASAKSWLCADNVDRLAPILPWNRNKPERQVSPVDAARLCLEHLRDAWNHVMARDDAEARMEAQDIVLTVPASFDAVARNLTVKAAEGAGLSVTLLEEPQAAFYSWLQEHDDSWRTLTSAGDRILVCDIGGGTTDFSLISVSDADGDLSLERNAVGNHILLGGDNLDLTLAFAVSAKIEREQGTKLQGHQIIGLTHACREAKEVLCADEHAGPQTLTVLGRGSSVIGGAISTELTFAELESVVLEGFFPNANYHDRPKEQRRGGLRSFGLNYASDPAVTRHLASFLNNQDAAAETGRPVVDAVLFNGGVTKANVLQERIVSSLNSWSAGAEVTVLSGTHPDLAVAQGAAWYGYVRRGNAIRIRAGSPHSYYVGIESSMPAVPGFEPPMQALCVVPFGMEEGTDADVPYSGLGLVVGESSEFRFFAAVSRQADGIGEIMPDSSEPEFFELPPLVTQLAADDATTPPGTLIPVGLFVVLSESGTLELWCAEENGERRWKLEYELRTVDLDVDQETGD